MPGSEGARDRQEATRLLVAAVSGILLLIVILGAGFYYLVGLGASDPFAPGLGLKDAALMVGIKLDLEAEVHLTARVRGDILVGLY